jgi:hypothetical protein
LRAACTPIEEKLQLRKGGLSKKLFEDRVDQIFGGHAEYLQYPEYRVAE